MARSKGARGPSLCHICMKEIEGEFYRIPVRGDDGKWVVGAHWKACYPCYVQDSKTLGRGRDEQE